jgi:hypothetical protein
MPIRARGSQLSGDIERILKTIFLLTIKGGYNRSKTISTIAERFETYMASTNYNWQHFLFSFYLFDPLNKR